VQRENDIPFACEICNSLLTAMPAEDTCPYAFHRYSERSIGTSNLASKIRRNSKPFILQSPHIDSMPWHNMGQFPTETYRIMDKGLNESDFASPGHCCGKHSSLNPIRYPDSMPKSLIRTRALFTNFTAPKTSPLRTLLQHECPVNDVRIRFVNTVLSRISIWSTTLRITGFVDFVHIPEL
jgi:hypothetical protein